ncbi:40S ribosomal protein S5-1 [Hordeum vulgare]|nr:40S ribosomal protein S5-1 [Hordeum vulgare]
MREGMLHIHDVEGPKKTGCVEARLEAMEQQVFKCQGMVERGLNANHMMIMEFTNKHKIDANDIGNHLSRLYDRIDHLQAQIYDLHNQNYFVIIEKECINLYVVKSLHMRMQNANRRVIMWVARGSWCGSVQRRYTSRDDVDEGNVDSFVLKEVKKIKAKGKVVYYN